MIHNDGDDYLAAHITAALAPCAYEGLLSRRAVAGICASEVGRLPAGMTSLFGFECRLDREDPSADFLVRTGAAAEEWPLLKQYTEGRDGEIWRRITELESERSNAESPLSAMLKNLWLEYDVVGSLNELSGPSIFFGMDRLTRGAETEWAAELAGKLRGKQLSDASRCELQRLAAVLPAQAKLFQIGMMCARPNAPLRVCVIGLKFHEIPGYLAAIEWPGDWHAAAATPQRFAPVIDQTALDLDLQDDGRLAPKLGVELYQKADESLGERFMKLVGLLNDGVLCVPQKATGLLAWGGITHERRYRDLWPAALIARRALRDSESSTFRRWLNHIKIVFEPGAAPVAKAYLAVSHAFLSDAVILDALQRAKLTDGMCL